MLDVMASSRAGSRPQGKLRCWLERLQWHRQLNPQPIRSAVEMQGATAPLNNRLDNRQAQSAAGALAVAPETLGQVLQVVICNARAVVADQKACATASGFQAQFHRSVARGMAQCVVQQIAQ